MDCPEASTIIKVLLFQMKHRTEKIRQTIFVSTSLDQIKVE